MIQWIKVILTVEEIFYVSVEIKKIEKEEWLINEFDVYLKLVKRDHKPDL